MIILCQKVKELHSLYVHIYIFYKKVLSFFVLFFWGEQKSNTNKF